MSVDPGQVLIDGAMVLVGAVPVAAGPVAGDGVIVAQPPAGSAVSRLVDLTDVEVADAAPGHALTRSVDGPWRAAAQAHLHEQTNPSTVWLISHPLPFPPAAVEVHDHLGRRHHPTLTHPSAGSVQLGFGFDVRGTARLS